MSCAVLTVSTTRTAADDESGPAIEAVLEADGHEVAARRIVGDEVAEIRPAVEDLVAGVNVVFVTGGTGPAPSDVTPEAVRGLAVKELDGFGERFRRASEEQVGAAAMFSRALAAIVEVEGARAAVFCLPGSPDGARLGAKLVAGELGHLVGLLEG